jgi:hypothetical protein
MTVRPSKPHSRQSSAGTIGSVFSLVVGIAFAVLFDGGVDRFTPAHEHNGIRTAPTTKQATTLPLTP